MNFRRQTMARKSPYGKSEVLERGNVYFFYRPAVRPEDMRGGEKIEGLEDVKRFYMVLHPRDKSLYRLVIVGRKFLPGTSGGGEKGWAFVDKVGQKPEEIGGALDLAVYGTRTRGERERPPARPAGEGVYAVVRHGDHTHLAYALEAPADPGEVQKELGIGEEGSYVLSVKNPKASSPRGKGLDREERARFPEELQKVFGGNRFVNADPPSLLDYEGAELLLIGAGEDVSRELGVDLSPEDESAAADKIFKDLRIQRSRYPVAPLFEGRWE
jgi:hypothetical protein